MAVVTSVAASSSSQRPWRLSEDPGGEREEEGGQLGQRVGQDGQQQQPGG